MIKTGLLGFVFIDIHSLRLTTTDIFQTVIRFLNNQILSSSEVLQKVVGRFACYFCNPMQLFQEINKTALATVLRRSKYPLANFPWGSWPLFSANNTLSVSNFTKEMPLPPRIF
jgi:hypothetical protein